MLPNLSLHDQHIIALITSTTLYNSHIPTL